MTAANKGAFGPISVVIPARNSEATITETLESLVVEPEVGEIILVDDGSTDRTAELARELGDSRIRVVQGPGIGISAALNTGFAAASLEFIARCDSDDLVVKGRFKRQLQFLQKNQDFVAISGGLLFD